MIWAPILSSIFRIIFMIIYNPYPTWKGRWKSALGSLRYGFWWGMDFDAYVFLLPLVLVTLLHYGFEGAPSNRRDSTMISRFNGLFLCTVCSLCRKNDLYKHFHDTYNYMVHYGNHAEKPGNLRLMYSLIKTEEFLSFLG